jgi:hypothetical protein
MYSAKKNNRVKRCEIIELPPKLISKHSILIRVFQAPERTIIDPSGARMDISEVFLHGEPLIEVYRVEGKIIRS